MVLWITFSKHAPIKSIQRGIQLFWPLKRNLKLGKIFPFYYFMMLYINIYTNLVSLMYYPNCYLSLKEIKLASENTGFWQLF